MKLLSELPSSNPKERPSLVEELRRSYVGGGRLGV